MGFNSGFKGLIVPNKKYYRKCIVEKIINIASSILFILRNVN